MFGPILKHFVKLYSRNSQPNHSRNGIVIKRLGNFVSSYKIEQEWAAFCLARTPFASG
jgi:hypothetical protein